MQNDLFGAPLSTEPEPPPWFPGAAHRRRDALDPRGPAAPGIWKAGRPRACPHQMRRNKDSPPRPWITKTELSTV